MSNIPGRLIRADEDLYTDWFRRTGDSALFRAQIVDQKDSTTTVCTVTIITKNAETKGDGGGVQPSGASITFTEGTDSPGQVKSVLVAADATAANGLLELIRYKISTDSAGWSRIRILPALQFDAGE